MYYFRTLLVRQIQKKDFHAMPLAIVYLEGGLW